MPGRITYYSNCNGSILDHMPQVESILRNFNCSNVVKDINDVIELYQASLFIDNGLYSKSWSETDIDDFKQKSKSIQSEVCRFFIQIPIEKVSEIYAHLEFPYRSAFWEIINKFKIWSILTDDVLSAILENHEGTINLILHNKGLVEHYDTVFVQYFKSHPETAEILLSVYIKKNDSRNKKAIFIPHGLTISDKEQILERYIDSKDPNPNYLQLISQITQRDKKNLIVSPKVRIMAETVAAKITDDFFKDKNTGVQYGINVQISGEKGIPPVQIKSSANPFILEYIYSEEYIHSCKGIKHLENFLSLFEFLDKNALISFVRHPHEETSLFDIIGIRAENEFPITFLFKFAFRTAIMQTAAYMQTLENKGEYIEDVLQQFYNEELLRQYNYKGLKLNIPGHDLAYLEKIRTIIPEIESIARQYNLYVKEGEIDPQVFELTDAIKMTDCSSLVPKKYIYLADANSNVLSRVLYDFFSDQSLLYYVEPYKEKRYNSLYQLLRKEKVCYSNYENYQKSEIDWLIDNHYLSKSNDGALSMDNPKLMGALYDLYKCDVCLYWNYSEGIRAIIDDYIDKGYLYSESTLLSHSEQDLFSFVFINERFSNALAYRNKYLHGNPTANAKDRNVYITSIMMLICLLFKIEHDLQVGQALKMSIS